MNSTDSISSSLLWRVQEQQPAAWDRFAQLVGPVIYHWCRRSGLQPDDAADVSQEVLRTVFTHISRFHRDRPGDTLRGWLWTITRNKVRDHFREATQRPQAFGGSGAYQQLQQAEGDDGDGAPDQVADEADNLLTQRALELVRSEFEPRTWEAFWRTTVERQRAADIADELGMSIPAIYQAKSRVLRRVRQELEGLI